MKKFIFLDHWDLALPVIVVAKTLKEAHEKLLKDYPDWHNNPDNDLVFEISMDCSEDSVIHIYDEGEWDPEETVKIHQIYGDKE